MLENGSYMQVLSNKNSDVDQSFKVNHQWTITKIHSSRRL